MGPRDQRPGDQTKPPQRQSMAPRGYAAIGLHMPKTPSNVGSVLRAAGCYGAAMDLTVVRHHRIAA